MRALPQSRCFPGGAETSSYRLGAATRRRRRRCSVGEEGGPGGPVARNPPHAGTPGRNRDVLTTRLTVHINDGRRPADAGAVTYDLITLEPRRSPRRRRCAVFARVLRPARSPDARRLISQWPAARDDDDYVALIGRSGMFPQAVTALGCRIGLDSDRDHRESIEIDPIGSRSARAGAGRADGLRPVDMASRTTHRDFSLRAHGTRRQSG